MPCTLRLQFFSTWLEVSAYTLHALMCLGYTSQSVLTLKFMYFRVQLYVNDMGTKLYII